MNLKFSKVLFIYFLFFYRCNSWNTKWLEFFPMECMEQKQFPTKSKERNTSEKTQHSESKYFLKSTDIFFKAEELFASKTKITFLEISSISTEIFQVTTYFHGCFENCFESVVLPENFAGSTATDHENNFSWSLVQIKDIINKVCFDLDFDSTIQLAQRVSVLMFSVYYFGLLSKKNIST